MIQPRSKILKTSFEREYNLKYLGLIGNVFSTQSIDKATSIEYNSDKINPNAKKSIGIDPGFGSSKFAIVVTQYVDGKIQIIYADEFDRPNFNTMIDMVWQLRQKCSYISNIYLDAANPEVWESLKREFGERYDEAYIRDYSILQKIQSRHRRQNGGSTCPILNRRRPDAATC